MHAAGSWSCRAALSGTRSGSRAPCGWRATPHDPLRDRTRRARRAVRGARAATRSLGRPRSLTPRIPVERRPARGVDRRPGGSYRLERREDDALFGHNVGPNPWKSFLFPSTLKLWTARRTNGGLEIHEAREEPPRYAFVGARSCDLHAIGVQDRTASTSDRGARAEGAFIVADALDARRRARPARTSMGTGPRASRGFDLALHEPPLGRPAPLPRRGGQPARRRGHRRGRAPRHGGRRARGRPRVRAVPPADGPHARRHRHPPRPALSQPRAPRWDRGSPTAALPGTMVCPTCFCHGIEDTTDLTGEEATRVREWDSCFTLAHSYFTAAASIGPPKSLRHRGR